MDREKNIAEEVKDAVSDNEHSIGEKAPGTPFAIVALSYLAILAAVGLTAAALVSLF